MNRASVNVSYMKVCVIQSKNGIMINVGEYLNTKNCSCKERLIGKLVLDCEDEILNTTETLLDDKKVICGRNSCLT